MYFCVHMYWTVVAPKPCRDKLFFNRPACVGAHTTLLQREPDMFAEVKCPLHGLTIYHHLARILKKE